MPGDDQSLRPERDPVVQTVWAIAGLYTRVFHQTTIRGRLRIPRHGPAIIVSNHTSSLDPVLIQAMCRRPIRWMMAREYYNLWMLRGFLSRIGLIPVTRSQRDMAAMREALRVLAAGHVLGVFPEGRIATGRGEVLPFQPGIGMIALKSGAPIFPVYLDGTQRGKNMVEVLIRSQRVRVNFGPALHLPPQARNGRKNSEQVAQAIRQAIESLRSLGTADGDSRPATIKNI
jgi:1-acyl-sn-glycerol-3-phosphate acyltransferase